MNALLFPGQGSQVVGMGQEFHNDFDIVKKIFKQADEKLKYPISKMILEGPEGELQLTKNTQPAILVVSYSIFSVLKNEFGFDLDGYGLKRIYGFLAERYMSFWFKKYTRHATLPIIFRDISELN